MSQRILHVLGTACLVPTYQRNHNGYFLRWDNEGFLFDPGEGTQRQLIHSGISASQITKIFISHFHGDHCLGLPGVIQRLSLDRVNHSIEVYYPASGQRYFENLRDASVFHFQIELEERPIYEPGIICENKKYQIETKFLDHSIDALGYRIQEHDGFTMIPEKLKAAGLEFEKIRELKTNGKVDVEGKTITLNDVSNPRKGQSFAYILDTRMCQTAVELANDVDMLICESTYLSDREDMAKEYGHLTAKQAGLLAKKAKVGKLVLTHFSQIYPDITEFEDEAKNIIPNVIALKDGDQVQLPKRIRIMN
ncbi:ribonuclease Z [candidate division KSB1 bacterium]|nr:ribonuclease Z [candidate division KSB1 bacterium]